MHIEEGKVVYDVGDRVLVTTRKLEPWKDYPTGWAGEFLCWGEGMEEYCGKIVTIASRICGCKYFIEEDGYYWTWSNTFFEGIDPLASENDEEIGAPNISEFLTRFRVN